MEKVNVIQAVIPVRDRRLSLLAEGKRLLAEARTVEDAKEIRDKAQAVADYLRQRGDSEEAMLDAAELKLRAERRLGELLSETVVQGGHKSKSHDVTLIPDGIGRMDSSRWQRVASLPEETFEDYLARGREDGDITTAGALRVAKELAQPGKQPPSGEGEIVTGLQTLIQRGQKFGTIYADPPWAYSNQATRAATDNHYRTMSVEDIAALPVGEVAADLCHLHLWTTNAFLFDCPRLFAAWGFIYQGVFVWCKPQIGIGNCWRVSHEFLVLAIKGEPRRFDCHDLRSWGEFSRDRHSAKPEQVRLMVEKASPGPYLELFSRSAVRGWTVLGNEVDRDLFTSKVEAS